MGMIQIPYGHGHVSRIAPLGPPQAYKTYGVSFPLRTHWRAATCEEVTCLQFLNGWKTILPVGDPKCDMVRALRGRYSFQEMPPTDGLIEFVFPSGQPCFKSSTHKVQLDRPGTYYTRPGNFIARVGETLVHKRADDWVDDFANHQDKMKTQLERG
jgi:hypothetical protein